MTYEECLRYLDRLGNEVLTMKLGLENIRRLLAVLGEPHLRYPSVIIGGTNGKGSVARFMHGALVSAGVRVGLYTSPHLVRIEERIVVGDRSIGPTDFSDCFGTVVDAISIMRREHHPTYFETVTAAAFLYFARMEVDVAILEVGLGGRLDSTNVVTPVASLLTPISLDHQNILGDRVEDIAKEKAGIIHAGVPVITAGQPTPAMRVIQSTAAAKGCRIRIVKLTDVEWLGDEQGRYRIRRRGVEYQLSAYGAHQVGNAVLAMEAIDSLKRTLGLALDADRLKSGIENTRHGAVLAKVSNLPATFMDGGHNLDAAQQLRRFLEDHTRTPRSLVLGMMRDKDIRAFFEVLKDSVEEVFLVPVESARAASVAELKARIPRGIPVTDAFEGLRRAQGTAATVLVTGSFYLSGQLLEALEGASARR